MDFEIVAKIVGAIAASLAAAFAAGKVIYDILIGYTSHRRESYKFAKDFFEFEQQSKNVHPYVIEKGYQAVAGNTILNIAEIKYLISLTNGDRALKDYVLGRKYLQHLPAAEDLQIVFKEKYKAQWSRKWRIILYGFLYFGLCGLAITPLVITEIFSKNNVHALQVSIVFIFYFTPFAYLALKAGSRIHRAQKLLKSQNKYPSNPPSKKIIQKASRKRT